MKKMLAKLKKMFYSNSIDNIERAKNMRGTPLRYPGGKGRLTPFIKEVLKCNGILSNAIYVEPFAGGAGVAINLLLSNDIKEIYINDKDRAVYAFWYAIIHYHKRFIQKIIDTEVTIDEWYKQKEIQDNKGNESLFNLGFSTFFLNRTNRSGILKAGVIGGKKQNGQYKLDVRFNKKDLIGRINNIYKSKNKIHLFNLDAKEFLYNIVEKLDTNRTFVYIDPPYYEKGQTLYMNYFNHQDHEDLLKVIKKLKCHWIVSYDHTEEILKMYNGFSEIKYPLRYTAGIKYHGSEIMFVGENTKYPNVQSPLLMKTL